jgi:hypothetical protein
VQFQLSVGKAQHLLRPFRRLAYAPRISANSSTVKNAPIHRKITTPVISQPPSSIAGRILCDRLQGATRVPGESVGCGYTAANG